MSSQRANQLVEAGMWLRLSGDNDGARRLFEQALKLDPTNTRAQQLLEAQGAGGTIPPPTPVAEATISSANPFVRGELKPSVGDAESGPLGTRGANSSLNPLLPALSPPTITPVLAVPEVKTAWDSRSSPSVQIAAAQPGLGGAMDLLAGEDQRRSVFGPKETSREGKAQRLKEEVRTLLRGAKDLLELDDHSGAMDLIVKAQQLAPDDPDVRAMRERSEHVLQTMFESKLGDLSAVPRVALKEDEIIWLNLDHRAGFVLAQIDGTVSYDDLFAVSGMSRIDTARILAQLVEEGVIVT